jgi:fumarate reductase subunit C
LRSTLREDRSPDPFGGEYGVVSVPDAWHVLSLLCFLASLGARFVAYLMPAGLRGFFYRPVLAALLVPAFAGLGMLFGLIALRKPETRGMARIALGLNGIVLVLSGIALAAFFYILPD